MSAYETSITNSYEPGFGTAYEAWVTLLPINKNIEPYGEGGIAFPFPYDYYWMTVVAGIIGFICAMGIGANDVANSFATSVGSKTLTLTQAVIIAGIFEFLGAVLLGKGTTETIKKKIVNVNAFTGRPDALMVGMLCAISSSAIWLLVASAWSFPVSTTHSIIGAIIGFALCMPDGGDAVNWGFKSKGFSYNLAAWVVAPGVSAIIGAFFYFTLRTLVLRQEDSFERALKAFPIIVGVTTFVVTFLVINKAGKNHGWDKDLGGAWGIFGVSCGVGIVVGIISYFAFVPKIRFKYENATEDDIEKNSDNGVEDNASSTDIVLEGDDVQVRPTVSTVEPQLQKSKSSKNKLMSIMEKRNSKLHVIKDDRTAGVHDNAEKFEYRTELAFGYVQVFTACAMSFAHGSNDVANSIGPLASIVQLYNNGGIVGKKAAVPTWILALGGLGIVVGLLLLGHKTMRALGVKLVKITAARGSCIELAAAFVVCFGSYAKLPLSTTQVAVGASLGIGLLDGGNKGVNSLWLSRIFLGWVLTFVIAGGISAMFFSIIYFAPSINLPLTAQNCLGNNLIASTNASNITMILGNFSTGEILTGSL